jgi:hypothetical protein
LVIDPEPLGALNVTVTEPVVALVWASVPGASAAVCALTDDDAAETFQAFEPFFARKYTVYAVLESSPAPLHPAFETVVIVTGLDVSAGDRSQ